MLSQPRKISSPCSSSRAVRGVVVEHRQPGAHAVLYPADVLGVDLVIGQLVDDVLSHAGIIYQADKRGAQFHVGNVLHNVAAHTAVHLFHTAGIASARDIGGEGIALDVHKNSSDDYDSHR